LNVIDAGLLLKSRTSYAAGDLARLGWTAAWPEARQTEVIERRPDLWDTEAVHLLGLWA